MHFSFKSINPYHKFSIISAITPHSQKLFLPWFLILKFAVEFFSRIVIKISPPFDVHSGKFLSMFVSFI